MKKLYYKIELRIKRIDVCNVKENDWTSYVSDGYAIIDGNTIKGFLTNDLIEGIISNYESMHIQLIEYKENEKDNFFTFSNFSRLIEFPNEYYLEEDQNKNISAIICFIKKEENVLRQKRIEEILKSVKALHQIIP